MAYFSNGYEGQDYQARYCDRCEHMPANGDCPIWSAHLFYAYGATGDVKNILDALIPMVPTTVTVAGKAMPLSVAGACRLFRPLEEA